MDKDSEKCYIALQGERCVGVSTVDHPADTARMVLEWEESGLRVEVSTVGEARKRLIAGFADEEN